MLQMFQCKKYHHRLSLLFFTSHRGGGEGIDGDAEENDSSGTEVANQGAAEGHEAWYWTEYHLQCLAS